MTLEWFRKRSGASLNMIHYPGPAQAMNDVMSGLVPLSTVEDDFYVFDAARRLAAGGAVSADHADAKSKATPKKAPVLAIAAGASDGLGFGHNARAALITRGLAETGRLSTALGGRRETLMGLAGLGDLVLTCTGDLSRNRRVGMRLAHGESLPAIVTTA